SALEPVVDALVRARRWDDAVEIVDEIAMTYRQAGSWVSTWNGDPLLANSRSDHRALCAIAIGLAESGDLEQGLAAAHRIDDTVARCAALAGTAVELARREDTHRATQLMAEHDAQLRMLPTGSHERRVAVTAAMRILVGARTWDSAVSAFTLWDGVHHGWELANPLVEALLANAELDLARRV